MKKLVVWGTQKECQKFIANLDMDKAIIVGFVETGITTKKEITVCGITATLFGEGDLNSYVYDILVIANNHTAEIYKQCLTFGVLHKTVFLCHMFQTKELVDEQNNLKLLNNCITENYGQDIKEQLYNHSYIYYSDTKDGYAYNIDWVRYKTFEIIAQQIEKISGDIAEVGVYKGVFASWINRCLPNKTFYLFDTFEGFGYEEGLVEFQKGHCSKEFAIDSHKDTSIELVLNKMLFPDKCVIKKGLFPETAKDLETTFSFVSLDVDFEESTLEGLRYFYPRLSKGGFIFVHDYDTSLKGVKNAVNRFEEEEGAVIKIPMVDDGRTLIITR